MLGHLSLYEATVVSSAGVVLFLLSLSDGSHLQMERQPVQWTDVCGMAFGLWFLCLANLERHRASMKRIRELERRMAQHEKISQENSSKPDIELPMTKGDAEPGTLCRPEATEQPKQNLVRQ